MQKREFKRLPMYVEDKEIIIYKETVDIRNTLEERKDEESKLILEEYGLNVPGVYCFYNEKQVYIGESLYPHLRLRQHRTGKDAKMGKEFVALVYSSPQLGKSSAFHIEGKLIQLADTYVYENLGGWKELLNGNRLNSSIKEQGRYFLKKNFENVSNYIWNDWFENNLVSCRVENLLEKNRYKLSPYTNLNIEQHSIVEELIKSWQDHRLIVVKGFPGTGKSVMAAALFHNLIDKDVCLTAGTENSLAVFVDVFKKEIGKATKGRIIKKFDLFKMQSNKPKLVIVDEGHRLLRPSSMSFPQKTKHIKNNGNELEMLVENFGNVIIFYDGNQVVHDSDLQAEKSFETLNPYVLKVNIQERLTAEAGDYVAILFAFLDGAEVESAYTGKYPFILFDRFSSMREKLFSISQKTEQPDVAILSGFTRRWITNPHGRAKYVDKNSQHDFELDGIWMKWSKEKNWFKSEGARSLKEVAYYTTVQGSETDWAGVIIGKDLCWDVVKKCLYVNKNYVGRTEKSRKNVNFTELEQKDLLVFTVNRYKILLTRATKGTFVYVEDENLRDKMRQIFRISEQEFVV